MAPASKVQEPAKRSLPSACASVVFGGAMPTEVSKARGSNSLVSILPASLGVSPSVPPTAPSASKPPNATVNSCTSTDAKSSGSTALGTSSRNGHALRREPVHVQHARDLGVGERLARRDVVCS